MSKNTKSILIGIVIGAIVLAGGQYAWSKYQASVKAKDFSVSMQGLKAATNKNAYLNTLFTEKAKSSGVSVGLSNSSASEPTSDYCWALAGYIGDIREYIENYPRGADSDNLRLAYDYWYQALQYRDEACMD